MVEATKRPFVTPYDLLGYLVPGGFLVTALAGYEGLLRQHSSGATLHTPVHAAVSYLLRAGPRDSWATDTVALATFIALIYVAGHVVASISAILIDRTYVAKAHGYPLQRLLGLKEPVSRTPASNFYRAAFLCLNAYLLFRFLGLRNGIDLSQEAPEPLARIVPAIATAENFRQAAAILAYVLVGLVAARLLLSAARSRHRSRWKDASETALGKVVVSILEFVLEAAAKPAVFITHLCGGPLRARNELDKATCEAFRLRLTRILGFEGNSQLRTLDLLESTSSFWYAAVHVRATAPSLEAAADNWLRLYGFARNLAAAFYVAFLYGLVAWHNLPTELSWAPAPAKTTLFLVPLFFFAGAFTMLLRYYYLYADYYTKYIVRSLVYLGRQSDSVSGTAPQHPATGTVAE